MPTREEVLSELKNITNPQPESFTDLPLAELTDEEALASSPNTPVDALVELTSNESPMVRSMAAGNAALDEDTLNNLAKSSDHVVRSGVAYNSSTSVDTLVALAKDEHFLVRMMASVNANLPKNVLEELTTDSNAAVRAAAARR